MTPAVFTVFRSPPSVGQKREQWGDIKNDDLDSERLERFLRQVFDNFVGVCRPGATAYICHGISDLPPKTDDYRRNVTLMVSSSVL